MNVGKFIAGLFFVLISQQSYAQCIEQKTIYINSNDYNLVGKVNYKQTLPLPEKSIVLTFDDGPYINTKQILKTLDRYCLKATFFVVGQMVKSNPAILEQIGRSGHTVGNHSYSHPLPFERLSFERQVYQIEEAEAQIKAVIGGNISPIFRFPGLGRTSRAEQYLRSKNISVWSVDIDTKDYVYSNSDKQTAINNIVNNALSGLRYTDRGMILMHDIHKNSADALPVLIETLNQKGYKFVHVKFK